MRYIIFILAFVSILIGCKHELVNPTFEALPSGYYSQLLGDENGYEGVAIVPSGSDYFILATSGINPGDSTHLAFCKVDSTGERLTGLEEMGMKGSRARAMIQTADGGLVLLGDYHSLIVQKIPIDTSFYRGGLLLYKMNQSGTVDWGVNLPDSNKSLKAQALLELSTGGYLVAAGISERRGDRVILYKLDDIGEIIWTEEYPSGFKPIGIAEKSITELIIPCLEREASDCGDDKYRLLNIDSSGNAISNQPIYGSCKVRGHAMMHRAGDILYLASSVGPSDRTPELIKININNPASVQVILYESLDVLDASAELLSCTSDNETGKFLLIGSRKVKPNVSTQFWISELNPANLSDTLCTWNLGGENEERCASACYSENGRIGAVGTSTFHGNSMILFCSFLSKSN